MGARQLLLGLWKQEQLQALGAGDSLSGSARAKQGGRRRPSEAPRGSFWRADSILRNPWLFKKVPSPLLNSSLPTDFSSPHVRAPFRAAQQGIEFREGLPEALRVGTQQNFDFFFLF